MRLRKLGKRRLTAPLAARGSNDPIKHIMVVTNAAGIRISSAAMGSDMSLIYVPLLDEGTPVVRPTQGVPLGKGLYRVLATPDYDPEDKHWMFTPDSIVRCVVEMREGEEVLVAKELAV
jgi:hypothetical protein